MTFGASSTYKAKPLIRGRGIKGDRVTKKPKGVRLTPLGNLTGLINNLHYPAEVTIGKDKAKVARSSTL